MKFSKNVKVFTHNCRVIVRGLFTTTPRFFNAKIFDLPVEKCPLPWLLSAWYASENFLKLPEQYPKIQLFVAFI